MTYPASKLIKEAVIVVLAICMLSIIGCSNDEEVAYQSVSTPTPKPFQNSFNSTSIPTPTAVATKIPSPTITSIPNVVTTISPVTTIISQPTSSPTPAFESSAIQQINMYLRNPEGANEPSEFREDCRYAKNSPAPMVLTHGLKVHIISNGIGICEGWVKVIVDRSRTVFWVTLSRLVERMPLMPGPLYDKSGQSQYYLDEDSTHFYSYDGNPMGYLVEDKIYAFDGTFLGQHKNGWITDRNGKYTFSTNYATGGPPLLALRKLVPIRGLPQILPAKSSVKESPPITATIATLQWSSYPTKVFFHQTQVVSSTIQGRFTGLSVKKPFLLENGQLWIKKDFASLRCSTTSNPTATFLMQSDRTEVFIEKCNEWFEVIPIATYLISHINGEFEGWEGDTLFSLSNGQYWIQTDYSYHYSYAYMPQVMIYKIPSDSNYTMSIEGTSSTVQVALLTDFVSSSINGKFEGWKEIPSSLYLMGNIGYKQVGLGIGLGHIRHL
ncbi:MAG: 4-fold beta flower protein [Dehalococcoidia bacterium]